MSMRGFLVTVNLTRHALAAAAGALLVTSFALSALAFPATINVVAKVSLGKSPKLVVRVTEPALKAVVKLKRDDGKSFTFSIGNVTAGTIREIVLDGRAGRHAYEGEMSALVDGELVQSPLQFETVVAQPIAIEVDRENLDLEERRLEIFTNREVKLAQLKIIGLSGQPVFESTFEVKSWAKEAPIVLKWKHFERDELMRLEVRVEDQDGFYNAIQLTPWQVEIPHEEVHFETGSARIEDSEVHKLEESLEKVQDALSRYAQISGVNLFIAGHTDTQGSAAYNLNLSRRRAQAIAAWFVRNKLPIPISYEGFGEAALQVKTADEVDEPKNRRVDYILSVEPPPLKRGAWKRLN